MPIITHSFVSGKSDGSDSSLVRPSNWNANHVIVDDGYTPITESWTYASASTISVPAGATNRYSFGDKIKLTNSSTKYFYVIGVASTLLTVTGGDDYALTDTTISGIYVSKHMQPTYFPLWFDWSVSSSPVGFSGTPTNNTVFWMNGRFMYVRIEIYGTSNSTEFSLTAPAPSSASFYSPVYTQDNSTYSWGYPHISGYLGTTIDIYPSTVSTTWTASGAKGVYNSIFQYLV